MKQDVKSNVNSDVYSHPFPCCVWNDVCEKYEDMQGYMQECETYGKLFKRSWELAIPLNRREKYKPETIRRFQKCIRIVRPYESISTRLEQLSLVQLRKLIATKSEFGHLLGKKRKQTVNKLMRKTIISLYARLANVRPPLPKPKVTKWTPDDWKYMRKRLKKLARPKKVLKPPKIKRKRMPLAQLTRIDELAVPRIKREVKKEKWVFKESMRKPHLSKRMRELAVPPAKEEDQSKDPSEISPHALKYKATARILILALPHPQRIAKDSDIKENAFEVARNALKYRATERTTELAWPKEHLPDNIVEPKISPNALKYKATPRIIKLAQPKRKTE